MLVSYCRKVVGKVYRPLTANLRVTMSTDKGIPVEAEQVAGQRKLELEESIKGQVAFNHDDSIVPDVSAGTKENPILVPSGFRVRAVGFENPDSHQLQWFNLTKGPVHYIPTIGLYFKLLPVE